VAVATFSHILSSVPGQFLTSELHASRASLLLAVDDLLHMVLVGVGTVAAALSYRWDSTVASAVFLSLEYCSCHCLYSQILASFDLSPFMRIKSTATYSEMDL
jgi:hypothetical protein